MNIDIHIKTNFCLIKVVWKLKSTFKMGQFVFALNKIVKISGFSHCANSCSAVMLGRSTELPESARKHWKQDVASRTANL